MADYKWFMIATMVCALGYFGYKSVEATAAAKTCEGCPCECKCQAE